jgi:hypothetical protein
MEDAEPQLHEHEMAWLVGHGEPVLPNRAQGLQVTPMPRRNGVWVDAYYCCSRAHRSDARRAFLKSLRTGRPQGRDRRRPGHERARHSRAHVCGKLVQSIEVQAAT